MNELDPHYAFWLSKYLSRQECVRSSWVSKNWNAIFKPLCNERLTAKQEETLVKLYSLTWMDWHHAGFPKYNKASFPSQFSVGSGTSTGKTVVALKLASMLVNSGKTVLVIVPSGLTHQWKREHSKFSIQLELGPLNLIENVEIDRANDSRINLTSLHFFRANSDKYQQWARKILAMNWNVIIFDEMAKVPLWAAELPLTYCFALNASLTSQNMAANHLADAELGKKPDLKVEIYFDECSAIQPECKPAFQKITLANREWLERLCEGKTLVLSNDFTHHMKKYPTQRQREGGTTASYGNNPVAQSLTSPRVNFYMAKGGSAVAKSKIVQDFIHSEYKDAVLLATATSLAKGFNLPVDTLVVLDLRGNLELKTLFQILGRVQRVQTSIKEVKVCLVSPTESLWKILALSNQYQSLGKLERKAKEFHVETMIALGKKITISEQYGVRKYSFLTPNKKDKWTPPVPPQPVNPNLIALPNNLENGYKLYKDCSFELHFPNDAARIVIFQLLECPKRKTVHRFCVRRTQRNTQTTWQSPLDYFETARSAKKFFENQFHHYTDNFWKGRGMFCENLGMDVKYRSIQTPEFYYTA